jgi:hypothetical protein
MCSKIGAAQVAAASTCTGLSEPRWLPAEDVSGENLTVWEAGVRQRGSTSEITNVPRSRVRQSGSRRSLPLCRPSATQSRLPGKMLLSQKINTRSDAGPHRKSDCERATQLSACGVAGWRLHAAHVREGNSAHAGWRAAVLRSGVPFVRVSSWHARVHVTCIHVHMPRNFVRPPRWSLAVCGGLSSGLWLCQQRGRAAACGCAHPETRCKYLLPGSGQSMPPTAAKRCACI